jgi:SAM-dependent methyltransferase
MNSIEYNHCPCCKAKSISKPKHPYATTYNKICFNYLKCENCGVVFVAPIPDKETFAKMYAKANYHDCHYQDKNIADYTYSTKLLMQYLSAGSSVLDYGCGTGEFLIELKKVGFLPFGVEFDDSATNYASQKIACKVVSVHDFKKQPVRPMFDAIHFGDVLEHLPNPTETLTELLGYLNPGGILFAEGPLESNPSPVYWASRLFGIFKRLMHPRFFAEHPPHHLYLCDATQQLDFFFRVEPRLSVKLWQIYETGWPYAEGCLLKRAIAKLAIFIGGRKFLGITFGNRFRGVFNIP